jgi:putative endonuclease
VLVGKSDRKVVGEAGEQIACRYLEDNGFEISDRNWRTRSGELDIIARHGDMLVFVEVKTRRSRTFGEPEEAVTPAKARKIRRLASEYLASVSHSAEVRFDVISVLLDSGGNRLELRHITDAF